MKTNQQLFLLLGYHKWATGNCSDCSVFGVGKTMKFISLMTKESIVLLCSDRESCASSMRENIWICFLT